MTTDRDAILIAVADVADLKGNQVAAAQFAVDPKVKQRKFSHPFSICRRMRSARMSLGLNGAF
jgi:hypothetical protein